MVAALSSPPRSTPFVSDPVFESANTRQGFADSRALVNPSYGPDDGFVGVDVTKAFGVITAKAPAQEPHAEPPEAPPAESAAAAPEPGRQSDIERISELEQALAAQQAEKEAELERARAQAFAEGQAQGQQEARQMFELENASAGAQRAEELGAMLSEFVSEAQGHLIQHQDLFDPIKKLALALAEQIARRELSASDASLSGFIQGAIAQLNPLHLQELVIHVSRDWYDRLKQPDLAALFSAYTLRCDDDLQPGSVRLAVEDASIEDFIEHRLAQLAESLLGNPPPGSDAALSSQGQPDAALSEPAAELDKPNVPADAANHGEAAMENSEFDDQGAIIQGEYSEVDDIFFQRPEED